ncbi:GH25 family lysozyme, partial [Clostridium sp.]|uniref:GH25 family lysozyme n=2 Tax=unclassified Clostridium TaxID=2614128 RepID=UPI00321797A4
MQNTTENNIIGPDLNEYRGDVDYIKVATQTPYCYLRGSGNGSGRFRIDKKFLEYVRGLEEVGIKTGAYHYAVPSADLTTADAQCDGFIEILQQAYGEGRYGDLFPVIDVEAPLDRSISTNTLLDWVDRFRKRFEQKTRRRLMLYTGAFFIDLYDNFYHTQKGFILADMPLWIAMYPEIQPNPDYPRDQGGWTRWRVWQFTENGYMPGINPPVDLNYGPENLDLLTQPENVRNFRAVAVDREIRVTWTPNTDIDLAGYNIFINSNYVTTVGKNANSYVLRLAEARPGERYEMAIEAFDTDGDFSQERSIAYATFGRGIDVNDEESDDYQLESRWNMDTEIGPDHQSNIESQLVEFSDPVDNLAKRFVESVEINENINLYDDFVETNDEFDDILYMKRLEDENVYKKYYSDREYKSELEFCETGEDLRCEDDYKKLMGKSIYTCPNCIKYHEGLQDHEEYRSEHHEYNDKEHEHHMKIEADKYSCEKHDRDYENYLDSEEYRSEHYDYKDKEHEHHMKSEAGENKGHEEQHKEHYDQKDKENEHHMESEAAGNKGHEEQYKEHHDQKGKENEHHM